MLSGSAGLAAGQRRLPPHHPSTCYRLDVERRELWRRLAQRPNAVRFEELRRLLELSGFTLEGVRGSHYVFGRGGEQLVVPYRRPHLLRVYVREALRRTREEGDE